MVKIGERVKVSDYSIPVFVSRIFFVDATGREVDEVLGVVQMLELDWGPENSKSKVALHDEGKTWVKYSGLN